MGLARTGTRWRWPNGVIPYTINEEDFPPGDTGERRAIRAAVDEWNTRTTITIQPRRGEANYIEFVRADEAGACSSDVGRRQFPGAQQIPCNPGSGALVHEIGHAAGLFHEHQREDRNTFVTVFVQNARSDKQGNFPRHIDDADDIGPYDYGSVMHYNPRSFAVDWRQAHALPDKTSRAAPALATAGRELHMVHVGESSNTLWHSWSPDGTDWTDDEAIPDQASKAAPALAVLNGDLHMVHLGDSSNDIWYSVSRNLREWDKNVRVEGQKSKATPALAAFNGELHMVHLGDSSNDLWHAWTRDGRSWEQRRIPDQKSKATPALATYGGRLHLVHLGDSSNDLWHSSTRDGRGWTPNQRIEDQRSQAPPGMCEFGGVLHLAHVGESSATIWHTTYDGAWRPNDRDDNNESRRTPALAVLGGELHSVHRGKDSSRLWHTVRDTSLRVIAFPAGVPTGGNQHLSAGDIATIRRLYP
jgi:hypothetical protein